MLKSRSWYQPGWCPITVPVPPTLRTPSFFELTTGAGVDIDVVDRGRDIFYLAQTDHLLRIRSAR